MKKFFIALIFIFSLGLYGCAEQTKYYSTSDFTIEQRDGWFAEDEDKLQDNILLLMVKRDIENNNYGSVNVSVDDLDTEAEIDEEWFFDTNMDNMSKIDGYSLIDDNVVSLGDDDAKKHIFKISDGDIDKEYIQLYLFAEDLKKGYVVTGSFSNTVNDVSFTELEDVMLTFRLKREEVTNEE